MRRDENLLAAVNAGAERDKQILAALNRDGSFKKHVKNCVEIKFYGAFALNRRVDLHATLVDFHTGQKYCRYVREKNAARSRAAGQTQEP